MRKYRKMHMNKMRETCSSLEAIARHIDENSSDPDDKIDSLELKEASKELKILAKIYNPTKPVIEFIKSKRYLFRNKQYNKNKKTQLKKFQQFWKYDDEVFRTYVRMNHVSFEKLYNLIECSKEFSPRQTPIKLQMSVALERLGSYDNGTNLEKLGKKWGFSSKFKTNIYFYDLGLIE